ncbi:proprotein convertase P-domain-containing protein [Shewanella insulae]|uniref:proprotein convertase P-domain-containing protein n=1 Tax=Shewanella insulae TaxID=2681496 RepID=UPI002480BB16|nr:proprotein convertase P-domain-containing protein [Shewanella insulae]
MKKTLLVLSILSTLSPLAQGSSEFHIYQARYDDPLLNMVDQDSTTLDQFYTQPKTRQALEEIKQSLKHSNGKQNNKEENPTPSLNNHSSITARAKSQNKSTRSFSLSVADQTQSMPAGKTATYHFLTQGNDQWQGNICLSLASSLPGARLSKQEIRAGETFRLSIPSNNDTRWGDYMFTITASADNGSLVQQQRVNLNLLPNNIRQVTQANLSWMPIDDNNPKGIQSSILMEDAIAAFGVRVLVKISHPWHRDLKLTLSSPMGTLYNLENQNLVYQNSQYQEYSTEAFNNEAIQGHWTLRVADLAAGDRGILRGWQLMISGYSPAQSEQAGDPP